MVKEHQSPRLRREIATVTGYICCPGYIYCQGRKSMQGRHDPVRRATLTPAHAASRELPAISHVAGVAHADCVGTRRGRASVGGSLRPWHRGLLHRLPLIRLARPLERVGGRAAGDRRSCRSRRPGLLRPLVGESRHDSTTCPRSPITGSGRGHARAGAGGARSAAPARRARSGSGQRRRHRRTRSRGRALDPNPMRS